VPDEELKAKVFISCGQHTCQERAIAREIEEALRCKGYDPYVAVQQQSLRGVLQNIFQELETSEYFLFIDFKREPVVPCYRSGRYPIISFPRRLLRRGSLFSHQELAIASYLQLPVVAFQEKGIKELDGLMNFIQANSIAFSHRSTLAELVVAAVEEDEEWNPHWKNQLRIERVPEQFQNALRIPENKPARFFHIRVQNLHQRKPATNCYVYLEHAYDISQQVDIDLETIEFKWEGYMQPDAVIGPKSCRHFDAFWVFHDEPSHARFNVFSDSTRFHPRLLHAGDYRLTYCVISENFPPARITCNLRLDDDLAKVALVAVDGTPGDSETRGPCSGSASTQAYGESSLSPNPLFSQYQTPETMTD